MKPILYWTLIRQYGSYLVLGVTSEGPRGRINGRFGDNYPTHTTKRDCVGCFDTQAAAEAKVEGVKAIRLSAKEERRPFENAISRNLADEARKIEEFISS